jgi:hypothetical protein
VAIGSGFGNEGPSKGSLAVAGRQDGVARPFVLGDVLRQLGAPPTQLAHARFELSLLAIESRPPGHVSGECVPESLRSSQMRHHFLEPVTQRQ